MRYSLQTASLAAAATAFLVSCRTPTTAGVKNNEATYGDSTYVGPAGYLEDAENFQLWSTFCRGTVGLEQMPVPNYDTPVVKDAATILGNVNKESFSMYKDILAFHLTPAPQGVTESAHNFLSYLCGEFRDRATMIKAKLDWVLKLRYLAKREGDPNVSCAARNDPRQATASGGGGTGDLPKYDPSQSPWEQMCIDDYSPYLSLSRDYFEAKHEAIASAEGLPLEDGTVAKGRLKINKIENIDRYVPGTTVCETKYMFAEYVKKKRTFNDGGLDTQKALAAFRSGYEKFRAPCPEGDTSCKAACSEDDLNWYYDFRGDSNFKPNSPEGNAMIWFARSMGRMCEMEVKVKESGEQERTFAAKEGVPISSEDCNRYFKQPFRSRFAAARAGLAAWLLQAPELERAMAGHGSNYYTIAMHTFNNPDYVFGDQGPYFFRIDDKFNGTKIATPGKPGKLLTPWTDHWTKPDMGLAALSGLEGDELKEFIYRRIRNAVDRHTDWYKSGYDSAPSLPNTMRERMQNNQAYSAFVASSYEMSESDNFAGCGPTIPCDNRPPEFTAHKHWMFIFKVRKENWMRPEDIEAGRTEIDFDRTWFDETAFGDSGLANSERAWDRLGSPLEEEHAEILYLYRIPN